MASTNIQTFPGKVGVSNTNPIHTLDIGSNVYIDDTAQTKLRIIGNIHASGVTVDGTITAIDSENLSVKDPIILLASGSTGTSDTGIIMKRADGDSNVAVFYDEGVGLKIGHTLSTAQDIHISVDSSNSLSTSIYGPVTVAHSSAQALVVQGGAEIADDFKVGASKLFVDVSESNVGIGTDAPLATLDVHGTANVGALTVVSISGDGSGLSSIQSSNVSDFASNVTRIGTLETDLGSNVTRIGTLETDLGSNVTRIGTLETDLGSNVTRITNLESSDMTIGGEKTFSSSLTVGGDVTVTDTTSGSAAGPEFSLYRNQTGTNGDYLGQLRFDGKHDGGNDQLYAKITGKIKKADQGGEDGVIETAIITDGSQRISLRHTGDLFHIKKGTDFQVGETANLYVDTSTSRVGIGMSNPSYTLDVDGDINLSTGSTLKINGTDAVFSNWTANGSDIYRSSGNVGIGTTSPLQTLHVAGNGQNPVIYMADSTNTRYASGMGTHHVSNEGQRLDFYNGDSGANGTSLGSSHIRMSIKHNGNVGIGTTNPVGKLDVWDGASNGTNVQQNAFFYLRNPANAATNYGAAIVFENTDGAAATRKGLGRIAALRENNAANYSSYLQFSPTVAGTEFEAMRITSAGNVGIGTTSPLARLDVQGTGAAPLTSHGTTTAIMRTRATNTNVVLDQGAIPSSPWSYWMQVSDSTNLGLEYPLALNPNGGNVGIGTTSPLARLDVYGTSRISSAYPRLDFFCTTGRSTNAWGNSTGAAGDYRIYSNGDASDGTKRSLNFDYGQNTAHTTRMCINADGNVGIGTSSPGCKLHVNGAICLEAEDLGQFGVDSISDTDRLSKTYIKFGEAGTASDWAYLRQIGGSNGNHIALDFHDDGNDAGFSIRDVKSTDNPDTVTTRFMVERGGNVGIGTTNPSAKLHVNGAITSDHYACFETNISYYDQSDYLEWKTTDNYVSFNSGITLANATDIELGVPGIYLALVKLNSDSSENNRVVQIMAQYYDGSSWITNISNGELNINYNGATEVMTQHMLRATTYTRWRFYINHNFTTNTNRFNVATTRWSRIMIAKIA